MRETIHMPPGAVMGSELILPERALSAASGLFAGTDEGADEATD